MTSKRLLTELIDYIDLYEQSFPEDQDPSLRDFLTFIESMQATAEPSDSHRPGNNPQGQEVSIARHLSLLHRYSRGFIKAALSETDLLQSEEEYSYLVSLLSGQVKTKTELNQLNAMEKTSGAGIIRRLINKGLATERPDDRDRRNMLVSITPLGRAELMKVFPRLHTAASLLSAPLLEQQRQTLDLLLSYLCSALGELPSPREGSELESLLSQVRPPHV